jgi:uncharacterized membrane protein YhhN
MSQMSRIWNGRKGQRTELLLTAFYFIVALVEIIAEYHKNVFLIYSFKPMLLLILACLYWNTTPKTNYVYLGALLFSWLANLFFISQDFEDIFIGAMLFFIYRILSIYIVIRHIKLPGIFPIVVGCVPFLFIYMYLVNLTYDAIGEGLVIFITQCILVSFLGGLSVGNYVLRSNTASTMLLMSTLFFAITQFIFVIRVYYINVNIFQPLAMALFVIGQYMFYKFLVLAEERWSQNRIMDEFVKDSEIL